jgi:hypothetical protein
MAQRVTSWFDQELRPKIPGLVPGYWVPGIQVYQNKLKFKKKDYLLN